MTVIYITHDVGEAVLLGQKVAVMRRGPRSSVKEEFIVEEPYPRKPTDESVIAVYAKVEASLQEEVGTLLCRIGSGALSVRPLSPLHRFRSRSLHGQLSLVLRFS